jgi:Xaa-Pro aminopeptidase
MVFTVEPGIYIPANTAGVDPKYWNIGVRIEDNVLVTPQGHEVLTSQAPKTIAEIEMLMANDIL